MTNETLPVPVVTSDQVELIRRTVAAGATDDELKLHLYNCQRRGIHPLDGLLHFTKRMTKSGEKYIPVASIDLMRSRAAETGDYAGNDDPLFIGQPGQMEFAATVTVWRIVQGQRYPFTATARWPEYYPGEGAGGQMWRKMPHVMLGKVAEALALRKAFPQTLSGLYESAEMDQADTPALTVTQSAPPLPPKPALKPEATPPADVTLVIGHAHVKNLSKNTGTSPKSGKPYTRWIAEFADGRANVTTFDTKLGEALEDARDVGLRCRYVVAPAKKAGWFDLKTLELDAPVEEEPPANEDPLPF